MISSKMYGRPREKGEGGGAAMYFGIIYNGGSEF